MARGIETGVTCMSDFLRATDWAIDDIDKTICHQVGGTHRKLMLESLGVDMKKDYATFDWLGNTGSAALPVTLAIACEQGFIQPDDQVALLGIGSGINSIMLGVQWRKSLIGSKSSVVGTAAALG